MESSGESWKLRPKAKRILLVEAPIKAILRGAIAIQSGGSGLGIGIVSESVGGKGGEAYLIGAVVNVGATQAVIGTGKVGGIRKDIGGTPAKGNRLILSQGVKVTRGVGAGNFIEKISFGISRNRITLLRCVEIKEAVHIHGKPHVKFIGNAFGWPEKKHS